MFRKITEIKAGTVFIRAVGSRLRIGVKIKNTKYSVSVLSYKDFDCFPVASKRIDINKFKRDYINVYTDVFVIGMADVNEHYVESDCINLFFESARLSQAID